VSKKRKNRQQPVRESSTAPTINAATISLVVWLVGTLAYVLAYMSTHPVLTEYQVMWFLPEDFWNYWWNGQGISLGFLDRIPVLIMVSVFLGESLIVGTVILDRLGLRRLLNRYESIALAITIGLHMLGLYTLLMGLAGLLNLVVFGLPLVGITAVAAKLCYAPKLDAVSEESASSAKEVDEADEIDRARWRRIAIGVAIPFLLVYILGGMNPARDFDVREYHLQAPKEWYQAGKISFLPHNVYASMPMSAEMPALAGMALWPSQDSWWWGAIVGKTIIACYAVLTWILLLGAGKRLGSPLAGAFAGLVYVTIPIVGSVSLNGLVDAALAHFTFATIYSAWLWFKASPQHQRSWMILTGILAGAAMSCKYPAVVTLLIPLTVYFAVCKWRETRSKRTESANEQSANEQSANEQSSKGQTVNWQPAIIASLLFVAIASASCAPWFLKNTLATGNPTYPLMRSTLPSVDSSHLVERWDKAHRTPADEDGYVYSPPQFVAAMVDIFLSHSHQSMVLWPLVVAGLLSWKRREFIVWFAGYVLFFILVWWLFTHRIDRFWLPILPPLALIAGVGLDNWQYRGWRMIVSILLLGYVFMLVPTVFFNWGDVRIFASLSELRVDQDPVFVSQRINPIHRFLNEGKSDVEKVLLVGDAQPFDLEVPAIYNTCFNECQFELLSRSDSENVVAQKSETAKNASLIYTGLQQKGISHIFVHWSELRRYRSRGNYGYSSFVTPKLMDDLEEQGVVERIFVPGVEAIYGELFKVKSK
jgi:hypothetical protein